MFYVYASYIAAMTIGITILAIAFMRDCRKAKEDLAKMEQEEDDGV